MAASARRLPRDAATWLGWAAEVLVVALLAFAPFAFGGVEPWAHQVVTCGAAALAVVVAVRAALSPAERPVLAWSFVPVVAFVALAAFQLVPLPAGVVGGLSPGTAALRAELVGPDAVAGPLSLNPWATARDLRLVLAATAVYVAVTQIARTPAQVTRTLVAVVAIGAAAAGLALAQDLSGATQIYWVGPTSRRGTATAGPFVHYSHYGQFANLTAGATLGLLIVALRRRSRHDHGSAGRRWPGGRTLGVIGLVALLLASATSVLLSNSRTAMSSMAAAAVFAAACAARSKWAGRHGWLAIPAVAALGGLLLVVGSEAALERWGTLQSAASYKERLQILSDMRPLWAKFPVFGSGLGTHETVFPMFDRSGAPDTATHAENEYAQALGETGAVGLAAVLAFAGLTFAAAGRAARRGRPPVRVAAIGVGAALAATAVHSLADFGQHLPANALAAAVLCGLAVSLSRLSGGRRAGEHPAGAAAGDQPDVGQTTPGPAGWRRPAARWVVVAVVAAAGAWAVAGASRTAAAAGPAADAVRLQEALAVAATEGGATNEDYAAGIDLAERAARLDPSDVRRPYLLAALRWQSISRVRDPETGDVVLTPESRADASRIESDLRAARRLCPTYGPLYSLGGQIRLLVMNDPGGAADVRTSARLSHNDPLALILSAQIDLKAGDVTAAAANCRRHLALTGEFGPVLDLCLSMRRRDLAAELAAGSFERLSALAGRMELPGGDPATAAAARRDAFAALTAEVADPDASADRLVTWAGLAAARNDAAGAIVAYQRALRRDYERPDWHLALARLLVGAGRPDEAARAAKACLLLRPGDVAAAELLDRIVVDRAGAKAGASPTTVP